MRGSHLNCVRFVRTSIRPMTNDTLQHGLSEMFFTLFKKWNPVNTAIIGPKKIGRINGVAVLTRRFFNKKKYMVVFATQPKKSGRNNEVAERRGSL